MSVPRYAFGTCLLRGRIYCVGGLSNHEENLKSCEVYDTFTDSWSALPELEHSRFSVSVVSCP
jgi:hypothetical protein